MNAVVKGSLILASIVIVLSLAITVTGLHTNLLLSGLGFLVVAILANAGVVFWVLSQTPDNPYGKQLVNGLMVGLIAGAIIFVYSYLHTSVLFPDYLAETREGAISFMESAGLSGAALDQQIAKLDQRTPFNQAFPGFFGTLGTSTIVGAIVAIFKRRK